MIFENRSDAGRELAARLMHLKAEDPVILVLLRGGLPVGFEIARALEAPLDVVFVRKIGVPGQRELAAAAVVDGDSPELVKNHDVIGLLNITDDYLDAEMRRELAEIERRRAFYLEGRARIAIAGRTAIVVDDGIATGVTTRAALQAVKRSDPRRLVLAVPVAPSGTIESLRPLCDEIVCLATPAAFMAIGEFYADFRQVADDEVTALLRRAEENLKGNGEEGRPKRPDATPKTALAASERR